MASPPQHHRSTAVWLAKASAIGLGGAGLAYLAYRAHRDSRWVAGLYEWAEALSSASACTALLARDLHAYLRSDEPELPASLRQVLRLAQSEEVRAALSSTSQAVLQGAVARAAGMGPEGQDQQDLTSRVLEAVLSDRGRGLVGMAVGLATRNATSSLCEFVQAQQQEWAQQERGQGRTPAASLMASAMNLLSSEQGMHLLSVLVTKSMKTAVGTYMESAAGFNPYDDLLASISKQGHRDAVSDIMSRITAAFCREVAAACARASGEAPTTVPSTSPPSLHPHTSAPPLSHSHQHKAGRRSSRSTRPSPHRPPMSSLTPSSTLSSAASSCSSLNTLHQHSSAPNQQQQQQQQQQELPARSQGNPTFEPGPAQEEEQQQQQQQQQQREGNEGGVLESQAVGSVSAHIVLPPPEDPQGLQHGEEQEQREQHQQQGHGQQHEQQCQEHELQQHEQQQHMQALEQPHGSGLQGSYESSSAFAPASSNADRAAQLLHGLHRVALHHRPYAQRQRGSRRTPTEDEQDGVQQQQQQSDQLQLPVRSVAKSVWVRHLAELAHEREVRTLCLDMVTTATREATYCTWEAVSSSVRASLPTFQDVSGPVLARQAMACAVLVLFLAILMRCVLGWRVL